MGGSDSIRSAQSLAPAPSMARAPARGRRREETPGVSEQRTGQSSGTVELTPKLSFLTASVDGPGPQACVGQAGRLTLRLGSKVKEGAEWRGLDGIT